MSGLLGVQALGCIAMAVLIVIVVVWVLMGQEQENE
jgi:hypothetical protein